MGVSINKGSLKFITSIKVVINHRDLLNLCLNNFASYQLINGYSSAIINDTCYRCFLFDNDLFK